MARQSTATAAKRAASPKPKAAPKAKVAKPTAPSKAHYTLPEIEAMLSPKAPRRDEILGMIPDAKERAMVSDYTQAGAKNFAVLKEKHGRCLWDRYIDALRIVQQKLAGMS